MSLVRTARAGHNAQMPGGQGHHQHRSVRVPDEEWADLDNAAREAGTNRAALIMAFIRWYLRRPGAKLPERPAR